MPRPPKLTEILKNYQPSKDLERFCQALILPDVKGNKSRASQLTNIDPGKFYYAYRTNSDFRLWFANLCFSVLGENAAIPPYALLGAIIDKDVQAIRTYYELTGKLKQHLDITGEIKFTKMGEVQTNNRLLEFDIGELNTSRNS
jgi:hypothetical protein